MNMVMNAAAPAVSPAALTQPRAVARRPRPPRRLAARAERSRWLALAMTVAGLGMIGWMFLLAASLPGSATAAHWSAAWVGLDGLEALGLLGTGLLLLRRDGRCCLAAMATATLLLVDAWFDVTTATPGAAERAAIGMAIFPELPTSALCVALAAAGLRRLQNGAARGPAPRILAKSAPPAPAGRLGAVRVLVIGSGGREHALVRALAADPAVTALHAAPGNPGIAELAHTHDVVPADPGSVTALAARTGADLVVIGPEAPLVAGVADALRAAGISCFGPGRGAAMIEGSKSFAKQVMMAAGIPTAAARTCTSDAEAQAALDAFGPPYVVKADGLAAGKGVVVTADRAAARRHAGDCGTVVIEEFLDGPEVSVFALADGTTAVPLLPAQDFKRAGDGGAGPNTGGMGAYAPLPWAPPDLAAETLATVIAPALAELRRRGTPYSGVLYTGLSLTSGGPRVVEFNARFGDPEAQVVLDRLATPLGGLLQAAAGGDLTGVTAADLDWTPGAAVTVVIAAAGYPGTPAAGQEIDGLAEAARQPGAYVLQAGTTARADGALVSSGGRVLDIVGTGDDVGQARTAAYAAAARITMRGGWYRHDIAASQDPGLPRDT